MTFNVRHVCSDYARASSGGPRARILLLPPVMGLSPTLNSGFGRIARLMAANSYEATALEFAGQNRQPGTYSVKKSCDDLVKYIREVGAVGRETILLFGICSGALAAIYAASSCPAVGGVFCWELSPYYKFTRASALALSHRFGLKIDWETVLDPVQPTNLLPSIYQPVIFGYSSLSAITTTSEQAALASLTPRGSVVHVDGVGHLIGDSPGGGRALADKILEWAEECLSQQR